MKNYVSVFQVNVLGKSMKMDQHDYIKLKLLSY